MNLRCLVVDDEPIARQILAGYIDRLPMLSLAGTARNGVEALGLLQEEQADILFLDIQMPELGGLEVAKIVQQRPRTAVIFTTAYPEFALDGFDVAAVDYLVKPIAFERFYQSVQRIEQRLRQPPAVDKQEAIFVKADRKLYRLPLETILYLEAYGDFVKVHCRDRMLLSNERLATLEAALPSPPFIRVHRSYIIALPAVEYIEGNHVKIQSAIIPVSRTYRDRLDG
jgi:DNA-binding LytR/AlgR family response regulator